MPAAALTAPHESATPSDVLASSQEPVATESVAAEPVATEPTPVAPIPIAAAVEDIERQSDGAQRRGAKSAKLAQDGAAQPTRRTHTAHRLLRKETKSPQALLAPFTHDQLARTFQQVRREYDIYRSKFGSRLEKEWGDVASTVQYMPMSDDAERRQAAQRLEGFRLRLRE